jgi:hypothetical protein
LFWFSRWGVLWTWATCVFRALHSLWVVLYQFGKGAVREVKSVKRSLK